MKSAERRVVSRVRERVKKNSWPRTRYVPYFTHHLKYFYRGGARTVCTICPLEYNKHHTYPYTDRCPSVHARVMRGATVCHAAVCCSVSLCDVNRTITHTTQPQPNTNTHYAMQVGGSCDSDIRTTPTVDLGFAFHIACLRH